MVIASTIRVAVTITRGYFFILDRQIDPMLLFGSCLKGFRLAWRTVRIARERGAFD